MADNRIFEVTLCKSRIRFPYYKTISCIREFIFVQIDTAERIRCVERNNTNGARLEKPGALKLRGRSDDQYRLIQANSTTVYYTHRNARVQCL